MAGQFYAWGMSILGLGMLAIGINLYRSHSVQDAKKLLRASVIYLPLFFALILADRSF
jgi:heme O synthase-like polyprenyltransferase